MTSHTHKVVVYAIANGKADPRFTSYHRSHGEAVACEASKQFITRHHSQYGMYADYLTRTIEAI
jgi:hypothetical protein